MYSFLERKFQEKYNSDIIFKPKFTNFEKIKTHIFPPFSFKTGYKKEIPKLVAVASGCQHTQSDALSL